MPQTRVGLIGFGGYGGSHRKALATLEQEGAARLAAVAEINQAAYGEQLAAQAAAGVAIYTDWQEMLAAGGFDVVAVATPLHLHRDMVVTALEKGYPVFCEKSAAVTVQDVVAMTEAADRTGLLCGIDFQLLSSDVVGKLKQLIGAGALGRVHRIIGIALAKRTDAYYQRAAWAGKFKIGPRYVLDGPMDNAFAHMLNNMLFMAAPGPGQLADPLRVRAEMYRAQPLPEMEDTATVQVETAEGIELLYLATYDHDVHLPHYYRIEGAAGTAVVEDGTLTVHKNGKSEVLMQKALNGTTTAMYRNFLAALQGKEILLSAVGESVKMVRAQNGAYMSSGKIHVIGGEFSRRYEEQDAWATVVPGLDGIFAACADCGGLPAAAGAPWAVSTPAVSVAGMQSYTPVSPADLRNA